MKAPQPTKLSLTLMCKTDFTTGHYKLLQEQPFLDRSHFPAQPHKQSKTAAPRLLRQPPLCRQDQVGCVHQDCLISLPHALPGGWYNCCLGLYGCQVILITMTNATVQHHMCICNSWETLKDKRGSRIAITTINPTQNRSLPPSPLRVTAEAWNGYLLTGRNTGACVAMSLLQKAGHPFASGERFQDCYN